MRQHDPRLIFREAPDAEVSEEHGAKGRVVDAAAPRTLKFPGGVREVITGRRDGGVMSTSDLAASMERTLERMQERLDALRHEVQRPMRLPITPIGPFGPDGPEDRTAA